MHISALFAVLSVAILLIGAPFYLIDILKHRTKPQRTTWFIWTVLGVIAVYSQFALHAHWSLLFIGFSALGNLIVFLLSLKYGVGGWKRLDIFSLVVASIGVVIALVAHSPLYAIIGVVIADFAGVVPTVKKVYIDPSSETTITWFALTLSSFFTVIAVGAWNVKLELYPVYLVLANGIVLGVQQYAKQIQHKT